MGDDLDFRFAMAATHLCLITHGQFEEALADRGSRRQVSMGEILVERGWIDREECRCLTRLLSRESRPAPEGGPLDQSPDTPRERYSWRKVHAEGGLGQVWLARDELLRRDVALKRIKIRQASNAEARRRFFKEAEITGQLQHPNIVPVYDLGTLKQDGQPYYVMKMVGGRNLGAVIVEHHNIGTDGRGNAAGRRRLLELFLRICDAIGYAHSRRVVHRDLKPDNIMVGEFGEVIVLDWGLAKLLDGSEPAEILNAKVSLSGEARGVASLDDLKGAPAYMSPEQAQRRFDLIDERTDVYGLGAILFEILTGRPPHVGRNIDEILRQIGSGPTPRTLSVSSAIPAGLDEICARAMAYSRADRYPDVTELAEEVKRWLADEPMTAYRAAVATYRQLAEANRGQPRYLAGLARNQTILGLVLSGMDRKDEAVSELKAAVDGLEVVIAARPAIIAHRSDLAANRVHLFNALVALGRLDEAGATRTQAETDYVNLIRADPTDAHHRIAYESALKTFGLDSDELRQRMAKLPAEAEGSSIGLEPHREGDFDWAGLFEVLVERLHILDAERFLEACSSVSLRGKSLVNWLIDEHWIDAAERPRINALLGLAPRASTSQFLIEFRDAAASGRPEEVAEGSSSPGSRREAPSTDDSELGTMMPTEDGGMPFSMRNSVSARRFKILRPLARGSLGIISVALDTELNREVALKEIREDYVEKAQVHARFLREAEIAASLEHPGIVTIYGLGHYDDGRPYYAMRLIRGETLKVAIRALHDLDLLEDHDAWVEALRLMLRRFQAACEAIAFAHSRGVLHRDLKPSNVMVGAHGETIVVDWGLAKVLGHDEPNDPAAGMWIGGSHETRLGSVLGTPAYMSPEQAEGRLSDQGPASDIYGLGAILYEILCGVAPFTSPDVDEVLSGARCGDFPIPRQVKQDIPPVLEGICLKAMSLNPADRHATPGELVAAIDRWISVDSLSGPPSTACD